MQTRYRREKETVAAFWFLCFVLAGTMRAALGAVFPNWHEGWNFAILTLAWCAMRAVASIAKP